MLEDHWSSFFSSQVCCTREHFRVTIVSFELPLFIHGASELINGHGLSVWVHLQRTENTGSQTVSLVRVTI